MIPEDSFLRNIPWVYETQGRMELEAVAFAIDAIYLKYHRISNWATNCTEDSFTNTPHHERLELFLDLWSIVDQADVLRRLLQKIKTNKSVADLMNVAEAARNMRNSMDHLSQNIPNLAAKKGYITPIYGALSFGQFSLDATGVEVEDFKIYTITAGSLTHKSHKWPVPNPIGKILDIPVGMFEFTAFDYTLDVSALVRCLSGIVSKFDTSVRDGMESEIRAMAKDKGLDADTLISEYAGSITTVINGKFA